MLCNHEYDSLAYYTLLRVLLAKVTVVDNHRIVAVHEAPRRKHVVELFAYNKIKAEKGKVYTFQYCDHCRVVFDCTEQ